MLQSEYSTCDQSSPELRTVRKKSVFFISTNHIWGGSEVLWTGSAQVLCREMKVYFATGYSHNQLEKLAAAGAESEDLRLRYPRLSLLSRVLARSRRRGIQRDYLKDNLAAHDPDLVVICQGNNIDGAEFMTLCRELRLRYVTITQLVTEAHWLGINESSLPALIAGYSSAAANYFVSDANRRLNDLMIGEELTNAEVVYNPVPVAAFCVGTFPHPEHVFRLAAVGRIECFHKGYDLLIRVLAMEKWKNRPLEVTIFGEGPHRGLLQRLMQKLKMKNVHIAGHTDDIPGVWENHQMLILPSRMEGQSLALIEAMWHQRGVIATNVGGAAELIENGLNGFLADSPSLVDIDACLEQAWQHRENWQNIGINAGNTIRQKYPSDPIAYFNDKLFNAIG